ncbi:hypothetical protein MPNT_210041 [Candidatus Methylacidithermus pantelleriae]|uniref:Uncharacterized protein n=1 Tax=Candidatus Methylacidithermus pantelleriae TaxID=2744239 RepID=A0A8J2BPQ8_9BACT|nr:hypothetical protein MPNT_210041 [Candidatus Methylacidithermus pantelleriae]
MGSRATSRGPSHNSVGKRRDERKETLARVVTQLLRKKKKQPSYQTLVENSIETIFLERSIQIDKNFFFP